MNPDRVAVNPPTRVRFDRVQADEILIVVMVLMVWAGAVYIFFNQWGKPRFVLFVIGRVVGLGNEREAHLGWALIYNIFTIQPHGTQTIQSE